MAYVTTLSVSGSVALKSTKITTLSGKIRFKRVRYRSIESVSATKSCLEFILTLGVWSNITVKFGQENIDVSASRSCGPNSRKSGLAVAQQRSPDFGAPHSSGLKQTSYLKFRSLRHSRRSF